MNKEDFAFKLCSGKNWECLPNSSWSEKHKVAFGDKPGFVICFKNQYNETSALATVIGQPFAQKNEIEANAKLIALAPDMAKFINALAKFKEVKDDIFGFVMGAQKIINELKINND